MAPLRQNVSIPSGDLYPDGITLIPANPDIQRTVRPEGSYFQKSPGYETVRPGATRLQRGFRGLGIHFTPMRFAEDVGQFDSLPLMVDEVTSADHADLAELPGSGDLDRRGQLSAEDVAANRGVKMGETAKAAPTGGRLLHRGTRTPADMGDREASRPLTRQFYMDLAHHPINTVRGEYVDNPALAVGIAGALIGAGYFVIREFERSYRSRETRAARGGGIASTAAPVAAAPAAAADTAGATVREAGRTAERAADAAAEAASATVEAAGDVVEAATEAVAEVTDTVADAVTGD